MARGDGDVLKGDGSSIWVHAIGSSSDQSGRSTYSQSPAKRGRMRAMSSVQDTIILRSEVVWFPRFILVCRQVLNWMNPEETDYEPMKRVAQCEKRREVQTFLKAYNRPHFDDLVHTQEVRVKKIIALENGHERLVG